MTQLFLPSNFIMLASLLLLAGICVQYTEAGLFCGRAPAVENGYVENGDTGYSLTGTRRTVRCMSSSFSLEGPNFVECDGNNWSEPGRCVQVPRDSKHKCGGEPQVENANLTGVRTEIGRSGLLFKKIRCVDGYSVLWPGIPMIACVFSPQKRAFEWFPLGECSLPPTTPSPRCSDELPEIENAIIEMVDAGEGGYSTGSTFHFLCGRGFELHGNGTLRCNADGRWEVVSGACLVSGGTTMAPEEPVTDDDSHVVDGIPAALDTCCRHKNNSDKLITAIRQGQDQLAKNLIETGADSNSKDSNQWTALMWAANNGRTEVAIKLLDCCANPNAGNLLETTAVMLAAKTANSSRLIRYLGKKGANVNAKNKFGATALLFAAQLGYTDNVGALLDIGANISMPDSDGNTSLIWAVRGNYTDTVQRLLRGGGRALVNAQNGNGQTALMVAAKGGYLQIAKLLLDSGALVDLTDSDGDTAKAIADQYGQDEIVALLEATSGGDY